MGSSTSKVAKPIPEISKSGVTRKFPTRTPPIKPREPRPPAPERGWLHPENTSTPPLTKSQELAGADPNLAARLQKIGPVLPQPTYSNSSTYINLTPRAPLRDPKLSQESPNDTFSFQRPPPRQSPPTTHNTPTSQFSSHFQPSASNPAQSIFPSDPRQNPAVSLLTARYRLAEAADHEFSQTGKSTFRGREFLDVLTITQILVLRSKGVPPERIEKELGLKQGVVARLGGWGVVETGSSALEDEA